MSEANNVAVVQQAYAAFGRGDIPAILAAMTGDVDWESFGPSAIPYTGNLKGKDAATTFFVKLGSTTQFSDFAPEPFIAQGDMVVVLGRETFTVTATGRQVSVNWAHAFTIRDGRIARFREYSETDAIRRAYGT